MSDGYSFVTDTKAFKLSRTAKNQKDFKIQTMDVWKHGKPYAMLVCPVYQLPARTSRIYQQASTRSVCIGTYTHLAVLSRYAEIKSKNKAMELVHKIFKTIEIMNPSKDANTYWQIINRTLLDFDACISNIWQEEKRALTESIHVLRKEALKFLTSERARIMKLSKKDAIKEILKASKIENKYRAIKSIADDRLLDLR